MKEHRKSDVHSSPMNKGWNYDYDDNIKAEENAEVFRSGKKNNRKKFPGRAVEMWIEQRM